MSGPSRTSSGALSQTGESCSSQSLSKSLSKSDRPAMASTTISISSGDSAAQPAKPYSSAIT
jgi:hypothetical protein